MVVDAIEPSGEQPIIQYPVDLVLLCRFLFSEPPTERINYFCKSVPVVGWHGQRLSVIESEIFPSKNFETSWKQLFLTWKVPKVNLSECSKFYFQKLFLGVILSTIRLRAKNKHRSWPLKAKKLLNSRISLKNCSVLPGTGAAAKFILNR